MFEKMRPAITALAFVMSQWGQSFAVDTISAASNIPAPNTSDTVRTLFGGKIKYFGGTGGPAVKFSRYDGLCAFMTGGRGAGILNQGFTIGGGGYGIVNSIPLQATNPDTSRYLTMGYGGLEFGYVLFPQQVMCFGGLILVGAGAIAWKSRPESADMQSILGNELQFFGVVEPTLYSVVSLFRSVRLNAGISYRWAYGAESLSFRDRDLQDFSGYVGVLFGRLSSGKSIYQQHRATR